MLADEIQRQTSRRGRIEEFSLGCSGPTSVAAPATVARFVADGDSTATITKPIPSSGEERESNPGHFTGTGQHSRPLHEGNGAKTLIGSPIPLLPYLLCLGQGSGGVGDGIGSVDNVWQEQPFAAGTD
jgi:hypothetical protein